MIFETLENKILENISETDLAEAFDPILENFLRKENVKNRLKSYLAKDGKICNSDDPRITALKVHLNRFGKFSKKRENFKHDFIDPENFEKLDPEYLEERFEGEVEKEDYEEGFEGFDDLDEELEGLENFIPAGLAVKVGGKIAKKVAPKLTDKIKDAGNKLIAKISPKLVKKQESEIAENNKAIEERRVNAINRGANVNNTNAVVDNLNAQIKGLRVQNANNSQILSNEIITNQQKSTIKILDEIKDAFKDYKQQETEKAKAESMPMIFAIVALFVFMVFFLNKK